MNKEKKLVNHFLKEEESFKDFLFDTAFANQIKDTPLKNSKEAIAEKREIIDEEVEIYKQDILKGLQLFAENIHDKEEQKRINNFFTHLQEKQLIPKKNQQPISAESEDWKTFVDDLGFLEEVAKRVMIEKRYEDASCMFRFIVQIFPVYPAAWVGWAICEQEQQHDEAASNIYDYALAIMPQDNFIIIYAAEFFKQHRQKEKAETLLNTTKKRLEEEGKRALPAYLEINKLIAA